MRKQEMNDSAITQNNAKTQDDANTQNSETTQESENFQKKDIIFSESIGVCRVDEITNLTQQNGQSITYYGLRSLKDRNKTAYVPVKEHKMLLRRLIDKERAQAIKNSTYDDESEIVRFEVDYVLKS